MQWKADFTVRLLPCPEEGDRKPQMPYSFSNILLPISLTEQRKKSLIGARELQAFGQTSLKSERLCPTMPFREDRTEGPATDAQA